jgi:subtilisin family serine protease
MAANPGGATPLPGLPGPVAAAVPANEIDNLFWQEQIHLLSAQRIAGRGEGVRIALIAGRANTKHPALAGASIKQFDARGKPETDDFDDYTTSIAALLVGRSGQAFTGVVPDANLLIVQVLDSNASTTAADMHAGVDAAIREGAQVICLTLGGAPSSEAEQKIYADAAKVGVVVVCAAGNEPNDEKRYPAAYPDCIAVSTVDEANQLAPFSTFGDWVTVGAPGVNLSLPAGEANYQTWNGGSFSCTIVAGTVALMLRHNPELDPGAIKRILGSVGQRVLHAGEPCKAVTFRMLDACAAIRAATHKNGD